MRRSAIMLLATVLGCAHTPGPASDPALSVEITATRTVLEAYRPAVLTVDPLFARPGQAPPSMTDRFRSEARQRSLVDSLQVGLATQSGDTLRVRLSEPVLDGRRATLSVTVDGKLAGGHPGPFYETVALTLNHDGARWIVIERVQLGIS